LPGTLAIAPDSQLFALTQVGTDGESHTFTLSSSGTQAAGTITPLDVTLVGTDASEFAITGNDCGPELPAGGSCTITVKLHPTRAGSKQTTLVASSSPGGAFPAQLTATAFSRLTITTTSVNGAHGRVLSSAGGINCNDQTGGTCSADFMAGTLVTLTPEPTLAYFSRYTGDCTGSDSCVLDVATNRTVDAAFNIANYTFLTSATYTRAQLIAAGTGLSNAEKLVSGADALCNAAAEGGTNIPAGSKPSMGTTYKAWISRAGETAKQRLSATGARGWVGGSPGRQFADSIDSLTDPMSPKLFYVVATDENGTTSGAVGHIWTGTDATGAAANTCLDWSSSGVSDIATIGYRYGGGGHFTNAASSPCSDPTATLRLRCFGTSRTAVVIIHPFTIPATQRRIFRTGGLFDPSTGIAAADALCTTEKGNLPGTYLAMLATTGTGTAQSRFTTDDYPFVRPDGVVVSPNNIGIFTAAPILQAAISQRGNGTYLSSAIVWTGGANPVSSSANGGESCNDWSSSSSGVNGYVGIAGTADAPFFGFTATPSPACSQPRQIYCLQNSGF
jgi:hypothetical protein